MPTSSRIRMPPTPSTSFSFFNLCGGRARTCTFTPRWFARGKLLAVPIRVKTLDDLSHFMSVFGDDSVVTRFGEILRLPIERHDERRLLVHHHGFLVGKIERRIAVEDFHA